MSNKECDTSSNVQVRQGLRNPFLVKGRHPLSTDGQCHKGKASILFPEGVSAGVFSIVPPFTQHLQLRVIMKRELFAILVL